MEELIEILEEINPDVDYASCTSLVDDGVFTSFELVVLVARIGEEFGVTIPPAQIVPENFNSAASIYQMIEKLEED
ncbi:MAG: acyl carrier protein [Lachnospiraceae bacterium]|nr:acyl carrier protein [Lachnospiraceae bacterium]